ncbi:MAG: hypothetical protein RR993_04300 [Clostridia bacterium]
MDELVLWSKTLLSSYDILPKILQSIDQCNMHTALGSFSFNGDPMEIFEQIMNANKRKEALVNLYVITTKTLGMIKPRHRQVLELKLVKGMRFEKIAETIGSCNRTVFRRYALGIAEFSDKLSQQGYDDKWFESRFVRDIFIGKFFEKIKEKSLFARLEEEAENEIDEEIENEIDEEITEKFDDMQENAFGKTNTNTKTNTNVLDRKNVVKDGLEKSIKSRCDGHCGHGHSGCENCATA